MTKPNNVSSTEAYSYALQGETFRILRDPGGGRTNGYALKNFTQAIEQASQQKQKYLWAMAHRGATYRKMGELDRALADLNEVLRQLPNYAWALAQRGEVYREMIVRLYPDSSLPEKALADFNKAIQINKVFAWAFAHRGATYYFLDPPNFSAAKDDLTEAIRLNDCYAWAFAYRGMVYWRLGDTEQANRDLEEAKKLDPNIFPNGYYELGIRLYYQGKYNEAIEEYQQELNKDPENSFALYGMAVATIRQKGQKNAQAEIDRARAVLLNKDDSISCYQLAGLAILEGETDQALHYLQQANAQKKKAIETANFQLGGVLASLAKNDLGWLGLDDDKRFQELISQIAQA